MSWDFFDAVYCISVDDREDRRIQARRAFQSIGLDDRVQFVIVARHPVDIEQGIYESHQDCIRRGLHAGARNILIFEDDVVFERFSHEKLSQAVQFLRAHPQWNVFLLGCLMNGCRRTESPAVIQVRYRSLAHAYAVQRPFAQHLAAMPWQGIAFDSVFCPYDHIYAIYPAVAFQSDAPSDNVAYLKLDRLRRMWGGFKRVQKLNELYHCRKAWVITAHILAAILAAGALWAWAVAT